MKAMVLAAGLGTRLRPLTNDRPKALVEVDGRTLLEITLARLRAFGVREVIVNAHHFADMIVEYLEANRNFGMRIEVSREDALLDTGGGLKKAAHFFLEGGSGDSGADAPFILHNVDVISSIDFARMAEFHAKNQALATLAVQERATSRYLLFDERLELRGRKSAEEVEREGVQLGAASLSALAFCGIHVISARLLRMMSEEGAFSIITTYLRIAQEGQKILAFRADESYWRDLGKPDQVTQAAQDIREKAVL